MSDQQLPPEQWRPLFDKITVEFGYRPLATHIGMDHTRLRRLLLGGGTTVDAVQRVADAFGVSPEKVRELRGEQVVAYRPFTLPDDAGRLTDDERDVIRAMVRALINARGTAAGTYGWSSSASGSTPGENGATTHAVPADTTEAAPPGAPAQAGPAEKTNVIRPAHWDENPPPPTLEEADAASVGEKSSDHDNDDDHEESDSDDDE